MNIPYIIIATNNKHKQQEFQYALNLEILTPDDLGILEFDPIECGTTFEQNALIKAQTLYHILQTHVNIPSQYAILADDSGLCVEVLQGAPGIFSARYAHMQDGIIDDGNSSDASNREALKHALKQRGVWGSKAFFQCSIAYIIHNEREQKNIQNVVNGRCHGIVAIKEVGEHGFGYDSMFYRDFSQDEIDLLDFTLHVNNRARYLDSLQHSLATLPLEQKTAISHRGQAITSLLQTFATLDETLG